MATGKGVTREHIERRTSRVVMRNHITCISILHGILKSSTSMTIEDATPNLYTASKLSTISIREKPNDVGKENVNGNSQRLVAPL